jgi:hypothetical protein
MKMLPATGGRPERPKILPRDRSKRYELASALDDETKPSLLTSWELDRGPMPFIGN